VQGDPAGLPLRELSIIGESDYPHAPPRDSRSPLSAGYPETRNGSDRTWAGLKRGFDIAFALLALLSLIPSWS